MKKLVVMMAVVSAIATIIDGSHPGHLLNKRLLLASGAASFRSSA